MHMQIFCFFLGAEAFTRSASTQPLRSALITKVRISVLVFLGFSQKHVPSQRRKWSHEMRLCSKRGERKATRLLKLLFFALVLVWNRALFLSLPPQDSFHIVLLHADYGTLHHHCEYHHEYKRQLFTKVARSRLRRRRRHFHSVIQVFVPVDLQPEVCTEQHLQTHCMRCEEYELLSEGNLFGDEELWEMHYTIISVTGSVQRCKLYVISSGSLPWGWPDCFHTSIRSRVWYSLNQYFVLFSSLKILKQYIFT